MLPSRKEKGNTQLYGCPKRSCIGEKKKRAALLVAPEKECVDGPFARTPKNPGRVWGGGRFSNKRNRTMELREKPGSNRRLLKKGFPVGEGSFSSAGEKGGKGIGGQGRKIR